MDFSVIICTYNRATNLPECLSRLAEQKNVTDLKWEVLLVDNNSTDATRQTIETLAQALPITIRYTFEPQQGLNYARNRGANESLGKYFCYVDDDIHVSCRWLKALYDSLRSNDADAVGGRIHLDAAIKLPAWITPDMYGFLGYQDLGDAPFQMDGVKNYPFGGNMAFNRRVINSIGLFNPKLGRKGSGQKRGELFKGAETDYFHRLAATNARIFYQPEAIVYHQILPFQLKQRYFRLIHYNAGYQKAFHDSARYDRQLSGIPLFIFPQFARSVWRYFSKLVTKGPNLAFRQQMTVGNFLGMIAGFHARKQAIQTRNS